MSHQPEPVIPSLPPTPLTEVEDRFCHEYLALNGNATRAYLRVNPSVTYNSAHTLAYRLLQKVAIQDRIAQLRHEARKAASLLPEQIAQHLEQIVLADPSEVWERDPLGRRMRLRPFEEMPPEVRGAIQEITIEEGQYGPKQRVKLYSKLDALKALAQIHGLTKQDQQGPVLERYVIFAPPPLSRDDWLRTYAPEAAQRATPALTATTED